MIPLYKPHMPDLPELDLIIKSGNLAFGKYGIEFENMLKKFIGNENLIVTNTYSNALNIALTSLGIKHGDEILVSPMACLVSLQPLISFGVSIKWVDVDPMYGTISPESLREKITKNTKAIIHNHFCGYLGDIDEINNIAKQFGIPVIDDCIEAFGSEYKGKLMGNVGTDITVFSFNTVRIPNTIEGGAVVFNNKDIYERSLIIRDNGIDRNIFRDEIGEINPYCDITTVGYNATMSNVNAYIGTKQMEMINELLLKQRSNAQMWEKLLCNDLQNTTINRKNTKPNYWVYGLLSQNKKETLLKFREKGFYSSGVHINNNIYTIFKDKTHLLGVAEFSEKFLAIPSGWWMGDNDGKTN